MKMRGGADFELPMANISASVKTNTKRMKKSMIVAMCALLGFAFNNAADAQGFVPPVPAESKPSIEVTPEMTSKAEKTAFKWHKKLAQAQKVSKETGLPIILLFTDLKRCSYCQMLEKQVLKKAAFKTGMKGVAVGVVFNVSIQKPGACPELKKYGASVPGMVVIDAEGNKLGSYGYAKGRPVEDYVKYFKRFCPHPYAKGN